MIKIDRENRFVSMFDPETGMYVRTGIIDERGEDTGVDPFMTSFPELIDVGVMGHCDHGISGKCQTSGVKCYQGGAYNQQPHMSFENFKKIVDECSGFTYQFALGGRGDVNKHPDFEKMVKYCREKNIVPNYTTSGLDLTYSEVNVTKENCGAVAISWYRQEHTNKALQMFLDVGMKTNIHYVLGNFSIDEAIWQLKAAKHHPSWSDRCSYTRFPEGVNAVIFLLHKPVGMGGTQDVLSVDDPRVKEFFKLVDEGGYHFKIGFDSCTVPGVLNYTSDIDLASVDTCEGGRWSMYITPNMIALPCSFDQEYFWGFDLVGRSIKAAWESEEFEDFRNHFKKSCHGCSIRESCMGGCPIVNEVVLCEREERKARQSCVGYVA